MALCAMLFLANDGLARTVIDSTRVYPIGEVVVTGSNQAVGRNLMPYTVSTVSRTELDATGQTQLLSALSGRVPGMFVSERNILGFGVSTGGSGSIKIRGVGGSPTNSILMMVDGQPQFAGIFSHHVADFYGTEYVERVEVLRGPGSVLYGSNAMGGVVNVITKDADKDGVHAALTTEYGSYDTWRTSLTGTMRHGRFSSLVSLGHDCTDGIQAGFDFRQKSLYAKVGYDLSSHWQMRADYSLMNFVGNDPVYPRIAHPESTDIYHQNVTRGETSLSLADMYGQTNGNVRVYYSYGNHYIDDPRHFHSLDDRFGVLAYQNFRPWPDASATIGFDFDTYTGKIPVSGGNQHTEGSMTTISRKHITEYSPYATLSQELFGGMLVLSGGLRMANSDRFHTQWVPQGGIVLRPGKDWMLKGSVAKGYRNPSFRELYLYRPANPDLDPERMMNYELTVGKDFSRYLAIDVTAYFSEGSNMIQTVDMKNVNTGRFINKGIEVSAKSSPADRLDLHATYSYLHTSIGNLAAAPKNQYYLGIAWKVLPELHVDTGLRGTGGLHVYDGMEHQDYVLLNMKLTYNACRFLDVFATLDNITNTHYTIIRGYDMPGFTAMGGIRIHL